MVILHCHSETGMKDKDMNKSEDCRIIRRVKSSLLRKWFCEYNEQLFGLTLSTCNIYVKRSSDGLGMFLNSRGSHPATIYINAIPARASLEYWTEGMLREVLLHEMVHYYVEEVIGRRMQLFCHGYKFRKVCHRLRKRYGVRVFVSGYRYKPVPSSLGGKVLWGLGWLREQAYCLIV